MNSNEKSVMITGIIAFVIFLIIVMICSTKIDIEKEKTKQMEIEKGVNVIDERE